LEAVSWSQNPRWLTLRRATECFDPWLELGIAAKRFHFLTALPLLATLRLSRLFAQDLNARLRFEAVILEDWDLYIRRH